MSSQGTNPTALLYSSEAHSKRLVAILFFETLFLIGVLVLAAWLRFFEIPYLKVQQAELADQLDASNEQIRNLCFDVVPREFQSEHNIQEAVYFLDKYCLKGSQIDNTRLLNYKAEIEIYAVEHSVAGYSLDDAFAAINRSLAIKKDDPYTLEWQGLAWCVRSKTARTTADQINWAQNAIDSFRQEFRSLPGRKYTLGKNTEFVDYCSAEIRTRALGP